MTSANQEVPISSAPMAPAEAAPHTNVSTAGGIEGLNSLVTQSVQTAMASSMQGLQEAMAASLQNTLSDIDKRVEAAVRANLQSALLAPLPSAIPQTTRTVQATSTPPSTVSTITPPPSAIPTSLPITGTGMGRITTNIGLPPLASIASVPLFQPSVSAPPPLQVPLSLANPNFVVIPSSF